MSITANDGGVLRKLGTISANNGGVIRNLSTVSTNDGGVLRTVFSAKKIEISGITPLVVADDHIVIVNSGTFTLSLPKGAKITLGSGAGGTHGGGTKDRDYSAMGGYVEQYTLSSAVQNASCEATVGAAHVRIKDATKLVIGSTTYSCGNVEQIIQTKWGPIGGRGGDGAVLDYVDSENDTEATDGSGAGGGGACGGKGGNNGGYGNYGGNGGTDWRHEPTNGSSGAASRYSDGGGGGGYASGGGASYYYGEDEEYWLPDEGSPGAGIIVIEW